MTPFTEIRIDHFNHSLHLYAMFRNSTLSAIATLAAMLFAPLPIHATPRVDPTCTINPGQSDSCTPLVACIGETGTWFAGRAYGWGDDGTLSGETNAGFTCTGVWQRKNMPGLGQGSLTCSNGLQAVVLYTSIDPPTGTVTGYGQTSDGQQIRAWSGHEIRQFLVNETGDVNARLMCGTVEIPLS
jgi:hypothetical protein